MKELAELCEKLDLPGEVVQLVRAEGEACPFSAGDLYQRLSTQAGEEALRASLVGDEKGFRMLSYSLLAGVETRERYRKRDIDEAIFYDTFQCFPRFVREHFNSFGSYGFDRSFWTWRHIGMWLFRLGELEFELTEFQRQKAVAVHIPSGSDLDPGRCRAAYQMAGEFFRSYQPEYVGVPYCCDSWLLSPALPGLLPPGSRILAFQRDFDRKSTAPDDSGFPMWVYQTADAPVERLPEDTSLRRNMKKFLLDGGKVGSAVGTLKPGLVV